MSPATRREQGSADVLALVWLAPVLLAAACLIIAAGRIGNAHQQLEHAAEAAAQAAALARTTNDATRDATAIAATTLADPTWCQRGPTVIVDTTQFHAGGTVTVTVRCSVERADLYGPFIPGSQALSAHARAVIDTYRATQP